MNENGKIIKTYTNRLFHSSRFTLPRVTTSLMVPFSSFQVFSKSIRFGFKDMLFRELSDTNPTTLQSVLAMELIYYLITNQ